jgi:hypothetical protein
VRDGAVRRYGGNFILSVAKNLSMTQQRDASVREPPSARPLRVPLHHEDTKHTKVTKQYPEIAQAFFRQQHTA